MTTTELPASTETTAPDFLARAREVAQLIEAEADQIEADATITKPVYHASPTPACSGC